MQVVNLLVTTPFSVLKHLIIDVFDHSIISYATYFHNNVHIKSLHLQEVPGLHQSTGRCYIFTQVSEESWCSYTYYTSVDLL